MVSCVGVLKSTGKYGTGDDDGKKLWLVTLSQDLNVSVSAAQRALNMGKSFANEKS